MAFPTIYSLFGKTRSLRTTSSALLEVVKCLHVHIVHLKVRLMTRIKVFLTMSLLVGLSSTTSSPTLPLDCKFLQHIPRLVLLMG